MMPRRVGSDAAKLFDLREFRWSEGHD